MWTIRISYLILLALAVNHLIYGFGCWGLQPGGPFSADLYLLQIVVAVIATPLACHSLIKSKPPSWGLLLATLGVALTIAIGTFCLSGWWIFTSAHFQGNEKLLPFFSASAAALIAGYIRLHSIRHT